MQKAWVIHPQDGKTPSGIKIMPGVKYKQLAAATSEYTFIRLLSLLPGLQDSTQVWSVELSPGNYITYLQKYDLMSVIHDVAAVVVEDFAEFDDNDGFVRADAISDYVCGVRSMEGVINNAVYGFTIAHGREAYDKKRATYNRWLETALKSSIPNSLVA